MLSRAGYSNVTFAPLTNSTRYTIGGSLLGLYGGNMTFDRAIKLDDQNAVDFDSAMQFLLNLTALENCTYKTGGADVRFTEAVPAVVLANKTISVVAGNHTSGGALTGDGAFLLDLENYSPGSYEMIFTVPGFLPTNVTINLTKWHTPIILEQPESVPIGNAVTLNVRAPENATGTVMLNLRDDAGYNANFTAQLADGVLNQTISGLPSGKYNVTAVYGGDGAHVGSTRSVGFEVYGKNDTNTDTNTDTSGGVYVAAPAPSETRFDVVDPGKGGSLANFKRGRTYTEGTFSDVDPAAWYFENVAAAFEYALMEGMGDGTFGVGAKLKLSEALALACRIHNLYYGGSGKFDQTRDQDWYTVYEDYAVRYGLIKKGEYDLTRDATRAQFAAIISAALPDVALAPINDVKTLPDVADDDPRLPAILRLYNAGILTGVDAQGSFQPDAPMSREQIGAMATRVADPALRKALTLT